MTLHLVDIASYQAGMDLAVVKRAGFSLVNIKTSEGGTYTYTAAPTWADKARALGLGISTFHWLTGSTSGRAQADRAYALMKSLGHGSADGMAHQCDNEDNATWAITRDYVNAMQDHLGRHVAMYTGDWWWTDPARRWNGASLTPYLWAAPNANYLGSYPGDTSAHWHAGYGGWTNLSLMQYAVGPITGAGGSNISKTAIRDPQVWAALTGTTTQGDPDMAYDQEQVDRLWAATKRAEALMAGTDAVYRVSGETTDRHEPNTMARELAGVGAKVDALAQQLGALTPQQPAPIDYDLLAAALLRRIAAAPAS